MDVTRRELLQLAAVAPLSRLTPKAGEKHTVPSVIRRLTGCLEDYIGVLGINPHFEDRHHIIEWSGRGVFRLRWLDMPGVPHRGFGLGTSMTHDEVAALAHTPFSGMRVAVGLMDHFNAAWVCYKHDYSFSSAYPLDMGKQTM